MQRTRSRRLASTCLIALAVAILVPPGIGRTHHETHNHLVLGAIQPRLSPSGKSIACSYQGAIWTMPRQGDEMNQRTQEPGFDVEPAWSPDESRIAFIRGTGSFTGQLRMIDARTGENLDFPRDVTAKDKLYFHPEGNRLLGCFQAEGGRFVVAWLDLDSGRITKEIRADQWGMRYALSHDGKSIALATTLDVRGEQGGNNGPQCDLWVLSSDGGEPKKVTRFPGRVYELHWTAENDGLFVVTNIGGVHNDLWQVPLNDPEAGARKMSFGQADEDQPSISRDGRWLLYSDNRLGPTVLIVRDQEAQLNLPVSVSRRVRAQSSGKLSLHVTDKDLGKGITARISVKQLNGKFYAPYDAIYRMLRGDVHFYAPGNADLELPPGRYLIKAARGPEYPVVRKHVEIAAGETTHADVEMKRWTNQRSHGWYSGESHIHANYGYGQWYNSPQTMLRQGAGEDLHVCNFMVANSEADGVFDREYFRGRPDPLSTKQTILYWNQEFRSTIWGHLTLLNLKQLVEPVFTGFAHTTHPHDHPTNADIADVTHDQHGHVNYTHPAHNVKDPYLSAYSAKALPLDVALGKVDSIDVMGSNHVATMPLWYRLLNCGFKIPASAGTDCFLNRVRSRLPGQDRAYVFVDGEFTYERWVESLRAGRSFVTNGPMFDFQVDRRMAGDSITLGSPGEVRVTANVTSQYPLNRVEIIYCGQVVRNVDVADQAVRVQVDETIAIPRTGWIAIRCAGPNQADQPSGTVFGHTSPVYVTVEGQPIDARKDAEYFVNWIERLRTEIRRRNRVPSRHQEHVESQISQARDVFNKLLSAQD